jgi:uncharacterized membrane protein
MNLLRSSIARWQANFFTGLAVLLPIVITLAVVLWLFGTVSNITDTLLFFLPKRLTHADQGTGPVLWNWSLLALLASFLAVSLVGRLTRYYLGRKVIQSVDRVLLSIPMLNKIYSTIKQVNDAFSSDKKSAFQQVVLVEFPRPGVHSVGFIIGQAGWKVARREGANLMTVFVPTTPNPTTGFLILVPDSQLTPLDASVAEGIRFIVSLGVVPPEPPSKPRLPAAAVRDPSLEPSPAAVGGDPKNETTTLPGPHLAAQARGGATS